MPSNGGAIYDFDMVRFGGPTVPVESTVVVGTAATRLLGNDPDRLAIYMTNNDAGPIYWSTKPTVAPLAGFSIGNGIVTIFQVQNDGALCGVELWGIAPAGPFTVTILVLRRQGRG